MIERANVFTVLTRAASTDRRWNKNHCVGDLKAALQRSVLSVSLEIPVRLSHGGKQGAYCVQVLLCLLDLARVALHDGRPEHTMGGEGVGGLLVALANSSPRQA